MSRFESLSVRERENTRKVFYSLPVAIGIPFFLGITIGFLVGVLAGTIAAIQQLNDPVKIGLAWASGSALVVMILFFMFWWMLKTEDLDRIATDRRYSTTSRMVWSLGKKKERHDHINSVSPEQLTKVGNHVAHGGHITKDSLRQYLDEKQIEPFMEELRRYKWAYWRSESDHKMGIAVSLKGIIGFANYSPTLRTIIAESGGIPGTHSIDIAWGGGWQ